MMLPTPAFMAESMLPSLELTIGLVVGTLGALLLLAFNFAESNAAMRGRQGSPLPTWVERLLRVFFLAVLVAPLTYVVDRHVFGWPVLTLVWALYLVPYTDLSEQQGGKRPWLRRWPMWGLAKRYFRLELVRTCPLDPERTYIFGLHPHGILPFGSTVAMAHECEGGFKDLFPGINFKTLVATFGFYVPLYREFLLYSGMADASRFSAKQLINDKVSIALVPGGATEALYVSPDKDVLYLRNRRGFIKLALEHGTPLVPIYSFNENSTYTLYQGGSKLLSAFKLRFQRVFGLTLPIVLNVRPRRVKITVVVGAPMEVPRVERPTTEEVDGYLEQYIGKVRELYDAHKDKYNEPRDKQLVII